MLYDPSLCGNFTLEWFSPEHWREREALRGAARGRGNTWFFVAAEREFALRHYRRGGLLAPLWEDRYLYRGESATRPIREFHLTRKLASLGLPVAEVVAARIQRSGIFYRGDLITQRVAEARSLAELLRASALEPAAIDWQGIGAMLARFHAAGLDHADLNAHNILRDASGRFVLIDFDRCRLRPRGAWQEANLARLQRSLSKVGALPEAGWESGWQALRAGYHA